MMKVVQERCSGWLEFFQPRLPCSKGNWPISPEADLLERFQEEILLVVVVELSRELLYARPGRGRVFSRLAMTSAQ